jgi:hypothetical protein
VKSPEDSAELPDPPAAVLEVVVLAEAAEALEEAVVAAADVEVAAVDSEVAPGEVAAVDLVAPAAAGYSARR